MNYYILPKNNNIFKLSPKIQDYIYIITPYTTYRLYKNYFFAFKNYFLTTI